MPLERWKAARFLRLLVNGQAIESSKLRAMEGSGAEAVFWLRHALGRHGLSLNEDDLTLTGTPLGLRPVKPGDRLGLSVVPDYL